MDPNLSNGSHFDNIPISPSLAMDYQSETLNHFDIGESNQDVPHLLSSFHDQGFQHISSINFQEPEPVQWEDGSNLVDLPIQFPPAAMDHDNLYTGNLGLSIDSSSSSVPNEQINTLPAAACFPTLQLLVNVGESSQCMLRNEGYNSGHCGYTPQPFSSPLMEVVQGATTSRHTQHETGNSSRRTYAYWSEEDVKQLIIAVREHGVRRKSWGKIVQTPYFKDKGRKKEHLLEKWRHMMQTEHPKDPEMKKLYIWAREVKAELE